MNVETYKLIGWEEAEAGLLIAENDEWVLVKHIPVDYVIDGYRLYRKEFVEKRIKGNAEKQIEKVLTLKKVSTAKPDWFEFADTGDILSKIEKQYGLFEFQEEEEGDLFYGKINEIDDQFLLIDAIMDDGSIETDEQGYRIDEIRTISFESDYFQSIRLLYMDENGLL
jgi:hypothetical protein